MLTNRQLDFLKRTPTCDLCDAMRRLGISGYTKGIYCLQGKPKQNMVGPAFTVQYMPKQSGFPRRTCGQFAYARMCDEGQILVIDAKSTQCWLTGGYAVRVAELAGAAGMVLDGCVRDKDYILAHDMPVFCLGAGTKPYNEELQLADINVPVEVAGCRICPGDILVGDEDGIVVIPADRVDEVIYQAEDIAQIEIELARAVEMQVSLEELNAIASRKQIRRA